MHIGRRRCACQPAVSNVGMQSCTNHVAIAAILDVASVANDVAASMSVPSLLQLTSPALPRTSNVRTGMAT
jgi:hypothetical protein